MELLVAWRTPSRKDRRSANTPWWSGLAFWATISRTAWVWVVEGGRSVEVGTGRAEWNVGGERKTSFSRKMKQLMKTIGVLRFPVNPKHHLSAGARQILVEGSDIPCPENVCAACLRDYVVLDRQEAIAVRQVRHSPLVATVFFL